MRFCGTMAVGVLILGCVLAPVSAQAPAQDGPSGPTITMGAEGGYDRQSELGLNGQARVRLDFDAQYLSLVADLSMISDGKYAAAEVPIPGVDFLAPYFLMNEGGLRSILGPVQLEAGRFRTYDVVDSPYALFVSSQGNIANLMRVAYEDDFFFYESRWIELNHSSAAVTEAWPGGFPERGLNLKTYGFNLAPGMRFGFQDAAVYTGRNFDFEYFLNPIPQYFIQYAKTGSGRPWTTGGNEGDFIGIFWDWLREDGISLNAQVLLDDFTLLPWIRNNPWKLAWTLGGRVETKVGSFGLFHAGATKYTFEPITTTLNFEADGAYGYSYYPDTRFDFEAGDYRAIAIEDNAIGYLNGENNLALRADWRNELGGFELGAYVDFRLAGSNSPANPWQERETRPDGTHLLDESVLEKRIIVALSAAKRMGDWRLTAALKAGLAFDALALEDVTMTGSEVDKHVQIYRPVKGSIEPILKLKLGASYAWRIR